MSSLDEMFVAESSRSLFSLFAGVLNRLQISWEIIWRILTKEEMFSLSRAPCEAGLKSTLYLLGSLLSAGTVFIGYIYT